MTNPPKKRKPLTLKHELEDLQEQHVKAILRFRQAEEVMSEDYDEARREMNHLEQEVLRLRCQL